MMTSIMVVSVMSVMSMMSVMPMMSMMAVMAVVSSVMDNIIDESLVGGLVVWVVVVMAMV